jgi:hypothetical protein
MKTFAVINQNTNIVENTVLWDGETEWPTPEGFNIVEITGQEVGIDFAFDPVTQIFTAPVYREPVAAVQPFSSGAQVI